MLKGDCESENEIKTRIEISFNYETVISMMKLRVEEAFCEYYFWNEVLYGYEMWSLIKVEKIG